MTYGLDAVAPDGRPTGSDAADRPRVVCYEAGEWTAVYLDGKLQRVGDTYLAHEWLVEHFGVRWVQDDAFLRGGDRRDDVAPTLDDLDAYAADRRRRHDEAEALRAKARALMARAELVETGKEDAT